MHVYVEAFKVVQIEQKAKKWSKGWKWQEIENDLVGRNLFQIVPTILLCPACRHTYLISNVTNLSQIFYDAFFRNTSTLGTPAPTRPPKEWAREKTAKETWACRSSGVKIGSTRE